MPLTSRPVAIITPTPTPIVVIRSWPLHRTPSADMFLGGALRKRTYGYHHHHHHHDYHHWAIKVITVSYTHLTLPTTPYV